MPVCVSLVCITLALLAACSASDDADGAAGAAGSAASSGSQAGNDDPDGGGGKLGAAGSAGAAGASGAGGVSAAGASGAAGSAGSGGSGVPSTQGDAPAGYCPGVEPGAGDRPCWDGNRTGCFACYPPLRPYAACSGVGGQPAPTPLPICVTDANCARRDTRCDPGHPYANSEGCRPPGCDEGASCPDGTVCDPSSPLANSPFLKGFEPAAHTTTGCRLLNCADAGGPACASPTVCDPTSTAANPYGCRLPSCGAGEPCPTGYRCAANDTCLNIPCNEPDAASCPAGTRCTASGGCAAIHCAEPGGTVCEAGTACDPDAPNRGCTAIACDQPGAVPCASGTFCAALGQRMACVECITNADCGCGSCVENLCYTRPGYCEPGCA